MFGMQSRNGFIVLSGLTIIEHMLSAQDRRPSCPTHGLCGSMIRSDDASHIPDCFHDSAKNIFHCVLRYLKIITSNLKYLLTYQQSTSFHLQYLDLS